MAYLITGLPGPSRPDATADVKIEGRADQLRDFCLESLQIRVADISFDQTAVEDLKAVDIELEQKDAIEYKDSVTTILDDSSAP